MSCSVGLTNFEYVVDPAAQHTNPLVQCTVHYAVARILPTSHHFPNSGLERSASSGVGRDGATPPSTRSIAAHPSTWTFALFGNGLLAHGDAPATTRAAA